MNYIGSKYSLLGFLEESINKIAGNSGYVFCDLFAGTGIVGTFFKKKGYKIIANDIQYYSYVLNRHYIGNHIELSFSGLTKRLPGINRCIDKKVFVCDYLSELKGVEGFIYNNYCEGGTRHSATPRRYFSDENGKKCDAIRITIEEWKNEGLINEDEYFFLLTSLLESIDKYANTASVYGAFLKILKKTAQKPFKLFPAETIVNEQTHYVYNEDVNTLIKKISGDILYLDPPYNHRQYATNYHLLETIAKYDNPQIHGKTGLRNYENQKSLFCSRSKVKTAFKELVVSANVKYIFLSYNNEGLLSLDDIKKIMSLRGKYGYFTKTYNRFKADKDDSRKYKTDSTTEYVHYVVCENNMPIDLK
jgi:adenine-specific DNA-methyltransferase